MTEPASPGARASARDFIGAPCRAVGYLLPVAGLWALTRCLPVLPPVFTALAVFALALPVVFLHLYFTAIRRTCLTLTFSSEGRIIRLLECFRSPLFALPVALASSFLTILHLAPLSATEWLGMGLMALAFPFCVNGIKRCLKRESAPWLLDYRALKWLRFAMPLLALGVFVAVFNAFGSLPAYETLEAARSDLRHPFTSSPSRFLAEAGQILTLWEGCRQYLLTRLLSFDDALYLLPLLAGYYVTLYHCYFLLAVFALPRREWARPFSALLPGDAPSALSRRQLAACFAALAAVMAGYGLVCARLEARAPQMAAWRQKAETVGDRGIEYVEHNGKAYRTALLVKLGDAEARYAAEPARLLREFKSRRLLQYRFIYAAMAGRVDDYLDWYYSLTGEALRLSKLLTGDAEDYLSAKLTEHLLQDVDLPALIQENTRFAAALQEKKSAARRELADLWASHEAPMPDDPRRIVPVNLERQALPAQLARLEFRFDTVETEFVSLKTRLTIAGFTGSVAGTITGIIAARTVGGALGKILAGEVAGAAVSRGAAGAAAGAAAGTVAPGAGNAIGAVVGVAVGVGTALAVDQALLKIEEAYRRDQYKAEILKTIDEARENTAALLR